MIMLQYYISYIIMSFFICILQRGEIRNDVLLLRDSMKNDHDKIIHSLDSSDGEDSNKKQKTVNLTALERELELTKKQLKSSQDEVAEWQTRYTQLQLSVIQNNLYLTNSELILQVIKGLTLPAKRHSREKRLLIDMNSGQFKWHSDKISALFDNNVEFYDAFFNKEYNNDYECMYRRVGTYDELEEKAKSNSLADVVLSDNPYVQRSGNHHGLNSSMASDSIKTMDRNYGLIGFRMSKRFLLLLMVQHLRYAERLLKVGGYLLLKTKQEGFNLNDYIIEASAGTCLRKIGELTFPTTPVRESKMITLSCSDNNNVTQLILFQRVATPVNPGRFFYPDHPYLTLTNRISILEVQSRGELFVIGKRKWELRNDWRGIASNIWTYLLYQSSIVEDGGGQYDDYFKKLVGKLGRVQQWTAWCGENINWESDSSPINWEASYITRSWTMLQLQQHVMDESQRFLDVINMCCLLFAEVLKVNGVSRADDKHEKKNNHQKRRACLNKCKIRNDYQKYFLNDTIDRLLKNAKRIREYHCEKDFLGSRCARM